MKPQYTRKFLGELFPSRDNANFEKAHLKAYINGNKQFAHGLEKGADGKPIIDRLKDGTFRSRPKYHDVKQELTVIN